MTPRAVLVPILLAVAMTGPASAQPKAAAAEALFDEGRKAMESKDYNTACARFRESNRLDPAPGTLLNLARCEQQRGKVASAWELYRRVLGDIPESDERYDIAKQSADALAPRLPKLTIRLVAGAPKDTVVRVGEVDLQGASIGVPLPIDPGKQQVEVKAAGRSARIYPVELAESEHRELEVEPGKEAAGGGGTTRTLGWVVGGVGVAGLIVGGVAGVLALGKKSDVDANCNADKRCTQAGTDAADSGKTLAHVSTAGWILGAAGVGIGAYLLVTSPSSSGGQSALKASPLLGGAQLGFVRTW